jgi:hypothetical protein
MKSMPPNKTRAKSYGGMQYLAVHWQFGILFFQVFDQIPGQNQARKADLRTGSTIV